MNRTIPRVAACLVVAGAATMAAEPTESRAETSARPSTDVALVHDIPGSHPRTPYFERFARSVTARSGGRVTVRVNPQKRVLAGRESLDAVRSGKADLAAVNMAHLEQMEGRAGFMNLPFTLNDALMGRARTRGFVSETVAGLVRPKGLELLGIMRGADQLFTFPRADVHRLEDLRGRRVRVAGSGIYERIMRALGAEPVALPITEIKQAMMRGAVDGLFTSPGGWTSQVARLAPHGVQVPGLMFVTYGLVANRRWLARQSRRTRSALAGAGRRIITDQWTRMQRDDRRVVRATVAAGATYRILPSAEVARWRTGVAGVRREFFAAHPRLASSLRRNGIPTR